MRATGIVGLVLALGVATTVASGRTIIDMPAPKGTEASVGEVALHRYSYRRVVPLYTYYSPPVAWPYSWSGWRIGWPYGYGYGWGWGGPWSYGFRARCGLRPFT